MTEPAWLINDAVMAIQSDLIAEYGGLGGIRDTGLLDSGLARPQNVFAYGEPSLFDLTAAYCAGIVRNHPFIDGNKRTGLMAAYAFLRLNGYRLTASEPEAVFMIRDLAAGEIGEAKIAAWIATSVEAV